MASPSCIASSRHEATGAPNRGAARFADSPFDATPRLPPELTAHLRQYVERYRDASRDRVIQSRAARQPYN
jgi:hypothetical protein